MIERLEKLLNCKQHLRDNLNKIIEAFVDYYGEEYREEIENKFSKALLIAYISPSKKKEYLRKINESLSSTICDKVMERIPSNWSKKDLFDDRSIQFSNTFPISYFKNFYEQYLLGEDGREQEFKKKGLEYIQRFLPNFTMADYEMIIKSQKLPVECERLSNIIKNTMLYYADLSHKNNDYNMSFRSAKALFSKIDPNITIENIDQFMEHEDIKALKKYIEILPIIKSHYEMVMQKFNALEEEVKENERRENKLINEYKVKYINENIDLLSEEELRSFDLSSDNVKLFGHYILGNGFQFASPFEVFSEESEKMLQSSNSEWKKHSIISDRISFFKKRGIDLGDKYEDYLASDEAKKIWPSFERVRKFIESRNRILNEFNNVYYANLKEHIETRKEIDSLGLLDHDDEFNASIYLASHDTGSTFVSPNIVRSANGYDLFSLVVISCNLLEGGIDHDIIHEFNHLFELTLCGVNKNRYKITSGWDISECEFDNMKVLEVDTLNESEEKRDYELFNEIINELIAQDIYTKMLEKNEYIFDNSETAKVKNTTSYEKMAFLIRDFFREFKEDIIASRRNNNIHIILDKVGKENFDELNSLFAIFKEKLQSRVNFLYDNLAANKDTPETRIYWELIARRDEIMKKMREHSLMNEDAPKKAM